ncbi:MAG: transcription termination factor Rho [Planctomycetaceae bacterium]
MAAKTTSSSTATKSARTTRRRKTAKVTSETDEKVDKNSDDFGAGLDDEPAPAKKRRVTRKKKVVDEVPEPKAEAVAKRDDDNGDAEEEKPRRRGRTRSPRKEASVETESVKEAPVEASERSESRPRSEADDAPSSEGGEGSGERPEGGGDRNNGGRRRRRKRGGRQNEGGRQPQAQQQGGRRRGRGGRNNKRGGPPQTRRLSKFEQNAAPAVAAVTSGTVEGVLELHPKGYGFLRSAQNDYGAQDVDPFVSSSFVEKYSLREGIMIRGEVGPGTRGQGPRVLEIESIDGRDPEAFAEIKHFDHLTAINPHEQIRLETGARPVTMRVMDLLTPLGKGQRALIVAPPRSGKTMLLQDIAEAVSVNHPEIHLIVLLIDERPEEVTEMRRSVKGDVIASSMDRDVESHVRISQLVIERGKRIAESGRDCLILMDSVTRCARAFNKWIGGGRESKIGTGGLDVRALEIPRKMFGTARVFDEGGSLTVCATALIDTGSRMDEAIFQEFKGTGNMELVLSRDLAERRIWPAIDISKSGTRREEKILDPELMDEIIMLRRSLVSLNPVEAMEQLTKTMVKFPSNREFLSKIRAIL